MNQHENNKLIRSKLDSTYKKRSLVLIYFKPMLTSCGQAKIEVAFNLT